MIILFINGVTSYKNQTFKFILINEIYFKLLNY